MTQDTSARNQLTCLEGLNQELSSTYPTRGRSNV